METTEKLTQKSCQPCNAKTPRLNKSEIDELRKEIPGWKLLGEQRLCKTFTFKDYEATTAFVDKVIAIAKQENHHPNISFGYSQADVLIWTHAINGLSSNDFILAAKIDDLQK